MKKISMISAVLLFGLFILTGCGANNTSPNDTEATTTSVSSADTHAVSTQNEQKTTENRNTSALISREKASEIALAKVKGAKKNDLRIHKDFEDGKEVYEGSIVFQDVEYDFEIDAHTGEILEWEQESVFDD